MSELSRLNPAGRFTGLADIYAKYRPGYPAAAIDHVLTRCQLGPLSLLVDIGSGTGISSRLFGQRGVRVLGIEPNADMRSQAAAEPMHAGLPAPTYHDGLAEATGLPDSVADAVLAAQAFHWFEPERTLREFHRILKAAGWVILLWNERDETDPVTAAFGAAVRATRDTVGVESSRGRAGEVLLTHPLFEDSERKLFRNEQGLDEEGLLGRAFSMSYAPREPNAAAVFATSLCEVFARHQQYGQVRLCYQTSVYTARRRSP
jgi:SAM-dependent methyltransferase